MKINFKPSYSTETAKIFFTIVFSTINYFLVKMNLLDFKVNIIEVFEISKECKYYKELQSVDLLILLNLVLIFYVIVAFHKKMFLRFYYNYELNKDSGFLLVRSGIFKAENFISIREIRSINTSTPNLWQVLSGARTIKIEADGVNGWDAILLDIKNPKVIESKIMEIKTELQRNRN